MKSEYVYEKAPNDVGWLILKAKERMVVARANTRHQARIETYKLNGTVPKKEERKDWSPPQHLRDQLSATK